MRNEGIINVIITTPLPLLYKSVLVGGNRQIAEYIAIQIEAVIKEIGEDKILYRRMVGIIQQQLKLLKISMDI